MATYTKTADIVLAAHALSTNPATFIGTAVSVATKISATIYCDVGFIEEAANTNPQRFRIQGSASATNNEDWDDLAVFTITSTGTIAREALTGASLADLTMEVASTTGFSTGMKIYLEDTGTLANGEWGHVQNIVTDTSVDIYDIPTNAKDNTDFICEANMFAFQLDLSSVTRLRAIFENEGATAVNCHYKVLMTTADTIA
jgi:hypothetical protein